MIYLREGSIDSNYFDNFDIYRSGKKFKNKTKLFLVMCYFLIDLSYILNIKFEQLNLFVWFLVL
jgi:hypothetical protein